MDKYEWVLLILALFVPLWFRGICLMLFQPRLWAEQQRQWLRSFGMTVSIQDDQQLHKECRFRGLVSLVGSALYVAFVIALFALIRWARSH